MAAANGRNFQVSGRGVKGHGWVEAAVNRMTGQLFVLLDKIGETFHGQLYTKTHGLMCVARA